jgi:hypothetical protein
MQTRLAGIEPLPEDDVFLQEDAPSPHVTRPGCYRAVVVHLKLHHLAVAAVDQAPQLAELAGAVTLEGLLGPAAAGFKVLRDLVQVSGEVMFVLKGGGQPQGLDECAVWQLTGSNAC